MKIGEKRGFERFLDNLWALGGAFVVGAIGMAAWRIMRTLMLF